MKIIPLGKRYKLCSVENCGCPGAVFENEKYFCAKHSSVLYLDETCGKQGCNSDAGQAVVLRGKRIPVCAFHSGELQELALKLSEAFEEK